MTPGPVCGSTAGGGPWRSPGPNRPRCDGTERDDVADECGGGRPATRGRQRFPASAAVDGASGAA